MANALHETKVPAIIQDRGGEKFNIDAYGGRPGLEAIDDTTAAYDTIRDLIVAKGGGIIMFPQSGYYLRAGRDIGSGVSIESVCGGERSSAGVSTIIAEPAATTPYLFNIPVGTKRFGFRNISLDGNATLQTGGAAGDTFVVIRGDSGGATAPIPGYAFNIFHAHNVGIRNAQVGYDLHTPGQCDWSNVRINGATIGGRWKYEHVNQSGCYYLNCTAYGLYLDEAIHIQLHDCYFGHGDGTGVGIGGTVSASALSEASITICHFVDLAAGIELNNAKYLRMVANRFDSITREAVAMNDMFLSSIIGSTLKSVGLDGYDGRDGVTPEVVRAGFKFTGSSTSGVSLLGNVGHSLINHTVPEGGGGMQYLVDASGIPNTTSALKMDTNHFRNHPRAEPNLLLSNHVDVFNGDYTDALRFRNRVRLDRDLEFAEGASALEKRLESWAGVSMDALGYISSGAGSARRLGVNTTPYTITNDVASRTLDPTTATTAQIGHVLATILRDLNRDS